jgi:2-C-methyl-D-erythritol 4-phosphate cytidylyltransferase
MNGSPRDICSAAAVIAAAGSGVRLPGSAPKQWRLLGGIPLIAHSFHFFDRLDSITQIAVSLDAETLARPDRLAFLESELGKPVRLVRGGASRQESVWNALRVLDPEPEIVLVHDAARPFPPRDGVTACMDAAHRVGGAILARPVIETIKRVGADLLIEETLDRRTLWAAHTPQVFRFGDLIHAYRAVQSDLADYTDDSAIFEVTGGHVQIIESSASNFKVTHPEDFTRAEKELERGARGTTEG